MLGKDKHGVLLFDAVCLRKSIAINSSNLTYSCLEDFGNDFENNSCHKDFADHAFWSTWAKLLSKCRLFCLKRRG